MRFAISCACAEASASGRQPPLFTDAWLVGERVRFDAHHIERVTGQHQRRSTLNWRRVTPDEHEALDADRQAVAQVRRMQPSNRWAIIGLSGRTISTLDAAAKTSERIRRN